jgi:predicted PurR-regulated permease PerM
MKDPYHLFNSGRVNFFLLAIITVMLFGAVLKLTSTVVLPFTIALLLALVTSPLVKFLSKFHIPRIISVLLIVFLIIGLILAMLMILYSSGRILITLYPKYEIRIKEIYIYVARFFELPYDEHLSIFDNIWGQVGIRNRLRVFTIALSNGTMVIFPLSTSSKILLPVNIILK